MGMLDKLNEFSSDNQEWVTFRADNELEMERKMGMQRVLKEAESLKTEYKEKGREEGKKEGVKEGKILREKEIVMNMLANNMDLETICKVTGLSLEEVSSLKS